MPQTVPSGVYSPDTYAVYADNFDLSLLSMDDDNSLRLQSQSFLSSSSDYLPSTLFQDLPTIKIEKQTWTESEHISAETESQQQTQQESTVNLQQLDHQQQHYQNCYVTSLPSPPHQQPYEQPFLTIFPPSPTPSIEPPAVAPPTSSQQSFTINFEIKQEYIGLFPPSPPDSNGAPSPRACDIKSEPDTEDTEASLDIDSLLQNSFEAFEPIQSNVTSSSGISGSSSNRSSSSVGGSDSNSSSKQEQFQQQDHQLLREYLLDTSFQRKHNLKPLALESLLGGWGSRGDIEPVISLALEHAKRDVQQTCAKLNISSG